MPPLLPGRLRGRVDEDIDPYRFAPVGVGEYVEHITFSNFYNIYIIFVFFIISTVLTYSKARKPLQILGSREYRGGKILCTHSVLTRWKSPVIVDFHVLVEGFFAHGAVLGDGDLREGAALKGAGVDFRYGFGDHHAF